MLHSAAVFVDFQRFIPTKNTLLEPCMPTLNEAAKTHKNIMDSFVSFRLTKVYSFTFMC